MTTLAHQSLDKAPTLDAKAQASGFPHRLAPSHHRPIYLCWSVKDGIAVHTVPTLTQAPPAGVQSSAVRGEKRA